MNQLEKKVKLSFVRKLVNGLFVPDYIKKKHKPINRAKLEAEKR